MSAEWAENGDLSISYGQLVEDEPDLPRFEPLGELALPAEVWLDIISTAALMLTGVPRQNGSGYLFAPPHATADQIGAALADRLRHTGIETI
ncbi:hypothetical protein ACX8Z9_04565 [Arthrobacter halodurans]|uniref:Uncharacterized protein n=1 Tax=Arthrobacter halodurans TaxID=516699 RepID=A0ABV4UPU9_9MICC